MESKLKQLNNDIEAILLDIKSKDTSIYLVGGYIRDSFLDKYSFDRDYVILGESTRSFAQKFAQKVDGFYIELDKEYDIARVVMPDKKHYVDFALCVGNSIEEDLQRRDFAVNSIAYDIEKDRIIDICSGIEDIKAKKIRAIKEQNFIDDPLRLLRAFRFAATLGFEIENETFELIKKHAELIKKPSQERINTELLKLLEGAKAGEILCMMKEIGFLYKILPFLEPQKDVPPNLHHHLCLIDHSIETVKQLENRLEEQDEEVREHFEEYFQGEIKRKAFTKFAALLHDVGKPQTWEISPEDGRHRFIKHDEVGAKMVEDELKKMKFGKNAIKYLSKLIKNHIYPSQLTRLDGTISQKALMRFFRKMEADTPDVIVLAMADRLSARGIEITETVVEKNISGLNDLLKKYYETKESIKPLPKLLSGDEIMEILRIPASKKLGEIITALKEAQISGDVNTREEAIEFVKRVKI